MGHGVDLVFEALNLGASAHDAGLQPLHVIDAIEDLILSATSLRRSGAG